MTVRASELHRTELLSRSILGNLPGSGVLILDRELRFQLAEGPALEPWGWRTDAVAGRALAEVVTNAGGEKLIAQYRAVLAGEPRSFDLELEGRCHSVNAVPITDDNGETDGVMVVLLDVTERHETEETLRASERDFRLLAENATDFVSRHDPDSRFLYASPSARTMFGYEPDEVMGRSGYDYVHPEDRDLVRRAHRAVLGSAGAQTVSFRLRHKDGRWLWVETSCRGVRLPDSDRVSEIHCVTRDIGERKRAQAELERRLAQQSAVAALGEQALAGDDPARLMGSACHAVAQALGVEVAGISRLTGEGDAFTVETGTDWLNRFVGRTLSPRVTGDSNSLVACLAEGPLVADDLDRESRFDASFLREHGLRSMVSVLIEAGDLKYGVLGAYSREHSVFTCDDANFLRAVGHVLGSAIQRRLSEDRARHDALHDPLTGLPNRSLLLDRLEHALYRSQQQGTKVAVLFLDIDNFKLINDSLGHSTGDELLRAVAPRLGTAVRPADTIARFGGDEFVVLAEDLEDEREAHMLAERLAGSFTTPFVLQGEPHVLTASIGVVMSSGANAAGDIIRDADAAMYRAKDRGRNRYEVFDDAMRARVVERLRTENELRRALAQDELNLCYQPYFSLDDGTIAASRRCFAGSTPSAACSSRASSSPSRRRAG
jgi:diguanylate cyclase (GGDEF)-like protein/PAS domain S-box-containing protein